MSLSTHLEKEELTEELLCPEKRIKLDETGKVFCMHVWDTHDSVDFNCHHLEDSELKTQTNESDHTTDSCVAAGKHERIIGK